MLQKQAVGQLVLEMTREMETLGFLLNPVSQFEFLRDFYSDKLKVAGGVSLLIIIILYARNTQ